MIEKTDPNYTKQSDLLIIEAKGNPIDIVGLKRLFDNTEGSYFKILTNLNYFEDKIFAIPENMRTPIKEIWRPPSNYFDLITFGVAVLGVDINKIYQDYETAETNDVFIELGRRSIMKINAIGSLFSPDYNNILGQKIYYTSRLRSFYFSLVKPREFRIGSTVGRHDSHTAVLNSRLDLFDTDLIAQRALVVAQSPPSWASYYGIFEDIAHDNGLKIGDFYKLGLVSKAENLAFIISANNSDNVFEGRRHGENKYSSVPSDKLISLMQARELYLSAINTWIDKRIKDAL